MPLWFFAGSYIMLAALFLVFWKGQWGDFVRIIARATVVASLFWATAAVMLGTHSLAVAATAARLAQPLQALVTLGVAEIAWYLVFDRIPRVFFWLWVGGLTALILCALPFSDGLLRLHSLPQGLAFTSAVEPRWFMIVRGLTQATGAASMVLILAWGWLAKGVRRFGLYFFLAIVLLVVRGRDTLLLGHVHEWTGQFLWLGGLWFFVLLWLELRVEVRRTAHRLDTDALTGARSRSFGEWKGTDWLRTVPLGIVFADVNDFKGVNDRYGHAVGDALLTALVRDLRIAGADHVVRMGGDEFLVLFPGSAPGDGPRQIEALRRAVASMRLRTDEGAAVPVSVSFGWAYAPKDGDWHSAVQEADEAMYADKRIYREERLAEAQVP